jgi:threonine aldolase
MRTVDLRSDTVSRPTAAMRAAMSAAPVGDDQYGEDPSVNQLEERIADLLGKDAGLFVPSGTMANQLALRVLTRPGDEVIVSRESHAAWHELGGGAANSGVQFAQIGSDGRFSEAEFRQAFKPLGHAVFPPTTLVEIENTHNRSGGIVIPQEEVVAICTTAAQLGMRTFLDGARLFNAAVATKADLRDLSLPFDLVAVSLSKGLGCPVGSVMAGSRADIDKARRHRRMLGGGMRQAGILAAAGLYALDHHVERLEEDHANARILAMALKSCPSAIIDVATVQTNIVVFHFAGAPALAGPIARRCAEQDVLISVFGGTKLRVTTHLDVTKEDCVRAGEVIAQVLSDEVRKR